MKKLLIFLFSLFFLSSHSVFADEIVMNKNGESVLLKSDGTWEVLSPNDGEKGKVIFLIQKATNKHFEFAEDDDFDKFSHFSNYVGCTYAIQVTNNTNHKVKLESFYIVTRDEKTWKNYFATTNFNQVIEPGESHTKSGSHGLDIINTKVDDTKELATDEQIKEWFSQYGCEAQKGSIFIMSAFNSYPDIIFTEDSGISEAQKNNFIIGSSDGVYPLEEGITLK